MKAADTLANPTTVHQAALAAQLYLPQDHRLGLVYLSATVALAVARPAAV